MNLIPLAALLIACLALAVSINTFITVHRRRPRQTQVAGDGSTQLQSGGTLIIPAGISADGREMKIELDTDPIENARRINARIGRHL